MSEKVVDKIKARFLATIVAMLLIALVGILFRVHEHGLYKKKVNESVVHSGKTVNLGNIVTVTFPCRTQARDLKTPSGGSTDDSMATCNVNDQGIQGGYMYTATVESYAVNQERQFENYDYCIQNAAQTTDRYTIKADAKVFEACGLGKAPINQVVATVIDGTSNLQLQVYSWGSPSVIELNTALNTIIKTAHFY